MRLDLKKMFKLLKDFYKEFFSKIILHSVFLQTEELNASNLSKCSENGLSRS